ncbi:MAG: T9SS type A sorting domain-containing protein [Bacteroidetes bacterium]|nr:T9SS type A sorting domain-containing protein [Bacteroidota bacterium]
MYYSRGDGNGTTVSWSRSKTGGTTVTNPFDANTSLIIQAGDTITLDANLLNVKNLTIDRGGKLRRNSSNTADMLYLNVYGDIVCNGTVGNDYSVGGRFDAIGINCEGTTCNITGSGKFYPARLRKTTSTNTVTTVTFGMNASLWYPGTAMYNAGVNTKLHIIIPAGDTVRVPNTTSGAGGCVSIDGTSGTDVSDNGGSITVNGKLIIYDKLYLTNNNTTRSTKVTVGTNGYLECGEAVCSASGAAKDSFIVNASGTFEVKRNGMSYFSTTNNYYSMGLNSNFEYEATGDQTIETGITYSKLTLLGSGNKSFTGTLNVGKDLIIDGAATLQSAATGANIIRLGGDFKILTNTAAFSRGNSKLITNGGRKHYINCVGSPQFYSLMNSASDTLALLSNIYVGDSLKMNGCMDAGTYTVGAVTSTTPTYIFKDGGAFFTKHANGLNGTFYNARRVIFERNNTIKFNSTTTKQVMGTLMPDSIKYLVVNNTGGDVVMNRTLGIQTNCTITAGKVVTINDTLYLGGNATLTEAGCDAFVLGKLSSTRFVNARDKQSFGTVGVEITSNGKVAMGLTTVVRSTGYPLMGQRLYSGVRYSGIKRFYDINPTTEPRSGATVRFYYLPCELNGISKSSLKFFRAEHWDSTRYGYKGYASNDINNNFLELTNIDSFSRWTLGDGSAPLPVVLTQFGAQLVSPTTTLLSWTTASEIDNDYFEVQRSLEGTSFIKVGEVNGMGTKNNQTDYTYTDDFGSQMSPVIYYRLKQIDYNGKYEFSPITKVMLNKVSNEYDVTAWYSQNDNNLHLSLLNFDKENITVSLFDVQGKLVNTASIHNRSSFNTFEMDMSALPRGMYEALITTYSEKFMRKVVKY